MGWLNIIENLYKVSIFIYHGYPFLFNELKKYKKDSKESNHVCNKTERPYKLSCSV